MASSQPPTVSLQPGSTNTAAVKQLQDWLVSMGAMSQSDVNTGYGTYGPKTTAAVLNLQQGLGVNNASGPGYWGPLTMQAVNTKIYGQPATTVPAAGAVPTNTNTNTQTTPTQLPATTASTQKAFTGMIAEVGTSPTALSQYSVKNIADALKAGQNDPQILAKYSDMSRLDSQAFQQSLDQLRTSVSTTQQQQQTQFENERKQLAEANAAAGTAYSGFRGRAEKQLAQSEQGIVTSSRAQTQKSLNDLTTQFETKYGTAATNPATASFIDPFASSNVSLSGQKTTGAGPTSLTGVTAGGITGTVDAAKQADISASANQSLLTQQFPKTS